MPTALAQWERRSEWPLAGVACLFLAAYSVQVLLRPIGIADRIAELVIVASWATFGVDFVVRLRLADHRRRWMLRHLHELVIIALPVLRPLRLLRLVTLVAVLQRAVGGAVHGRIVTYTATTTALLVYVASLAMLDAERGHGGPIQTFPDALWWAVTTITTVGYGDYTPATSTGRCVAVALMLGGIGLIGVVTATLASWIVRRVSEEEDAQHATKTQIEGLLGEIRALRRQVSYLEGSLLSAQSRTP